MAEKETKVEQVVFIMIPELNKPEYKGGVLVSQDTAVHENGQLVKAEQTDRLDPDGFGIFSWRSDHENHDRRLKAMLMFKEDSDNPKLVGPFKSRDEALKKMHAVRPKSAQEENANLKADNQAQAGVIAELREKLAAAKTKK